MFIGYARISTLEQSLDLQMDALKKAGCEKIFTDKMTGGVSDRPGLTKLKEVLRKGDTIVIWRLDRLGRSLKNLIALVEEFKEKGVGINSITEKIDTASTAGKLIFHVFGALAEFERGLIQERVRAGLEAARARGRMGGRPIKLNADKRLAVVALYKEQKYPVDQICRMFDITKPTMYKYLLMKK